MKPKLKPAGTNRLKPQYDDPPSKFAFKFSLRRYNQVNEVVAGRARLTQVLPGGREAGAFTRSHFSST
jgi:hypothetical protein